MPGILGFQTFSIPKSRDSILYPGYNGIIPEENCQNYFPNMRKLVRTCGSIMSTFQCILLLILFTRSTFYETINARKSTGATYRPTRVAIRKTVNHLLTDGVFISMIVMRLTMVASFLVDLHLLKRDRAACWSSFLIFAEKYDLNCRTCQKTSRCALISATWNSVFSAGLVQIVREYSAVQSWVSKWQPLANILPVTSLTFYNTSSYI